jgi:hypothetical protein
MEVYVIVATDESRIPTRIARSSVVEDLPPGTYVEAALQQHPALLSNMVKLCKELADCKLDGTDEDELCIMFATRLSEAVQKNKGSGAPLQNRLALFVANSSFLQLLAGTGSTQTH